MSAVMRSPAFTLEEFNELVSATFDGIGTPDLVLAARPRSTSPPPPQEQPRQSALSLLRKVKIRVHDAVARHHHDAETHPAIPIAPPHTRTRAKSLPRSFFNLSPVTPDSDALPPVPPIPHSFFDEDSDSDASIPPPINVRPRPSTPLGAFRRLSSLFESPPRGVPLDADQTRPMSPLHKATSVPLFRSPKREFEGAAPHPEPPSPSRPSITTKLRTLTLSRSRLGLFSGSPAPSPTTAVPPHPYSPPVEPNSPSQSTPTLSLSPSATPVTPAFPHTTSPARQPSESQEVRPITPEPDPFRKGTVGVKDSPSSSSSSSPSRKRKIHKSRSTPGLFGIRSSIDSDDRSHSHDSHPPLPLPICVSKPYQLRPLHIPSHNGVSHKAPCSSPLSFTFPLPPNSAPPHRVRGGLTVTVTTPPPAFPPPAFPPPRSPPPNIPLPSLPHARGRGKPLPQIPVPATALRDQLRAGIRSARVRKDSKDSVQLLRARSQREREMRMKRRGVLMREQAHARDKERNVRTRPGSPFPLPLEKSVGSARKRHAENGRERVQELVAAAGLAEEPEADPIRFTNPWVGDGQLEVESADLSMDVDVRPDSEVEPEYMRSSFEAQKKDSMSSTLSGSSLRSDTTRTSVTSITSLSGASVGSGETHGTVMPPAARDDSEVMGTVCADASSSTCEHPREVRAPSAADTVRRQRIAYARRFHADIEDMDADADDEASPGSMGAELEGELLKMPGAFPQSWDPHHTADAHESIWHRHARRLSHLRLSIPVPLDLGSLDVADIPETEGSALGLRGVPVLSEGDCDGGRSGWFE
ncbi:hypothetical protein DENSPDRAFT_457565 [Dentipellis sp. KUC8613]|nr:hypothetical protein DENSPDRAFT_457565 [Dentipellis sp. KUC8613]